MTQKEFQESLFPEESDKKDDVLEKPTYYVNVAHINSTFYDFAIALGVKKNRHMRVNGEDIDFVVLMSPQHAKEFARLLLDQIENYERLFGEIKLPKLAKQ